MRNWDILSRYRNELMGIATLWIVLLHSTIWFSFFPAAYLKMTGYCGVDCFLLLSAMGLYFSWQKGNHNIGSFYRRRLLRIFPAYLIVLVIRFFLEQTGKRYVVLAATTLSFWLMDDLSAWFIAGITVLYLVSPLVLKVMESKQRTIGMAGFFALALLAGVLMRRTPQNLFFVRIPSFLLGFIIGKLVYEKRAVTNRTEWILAAAFAFGTILMVICQRGMVSAYETLDWALRWYSVLLFEVPLLVYLARVFHWLKEHGHTLLNRGLASIGSISLEIYLLFEVLLRFFRETWLARLPFEYRGWVYSLIILAMTIAIGTLVHKASSLVISVLSRTNNN